MKLIQFVVTHPTVSNLLAKWGEDFIDGWTGDGLLDEVRCDGSNVSAGLRRALSKFLAGRLGKSELHFQFGRLFNCCCHMHRLANLPQNPAGVSRDES
jgi:hypothetical protein